MTSNSDSISLNKFISSSGICSRREADKMIKSGRVILNGKIAEPGNRVFDGDTVLVDGKRVKPIEKIEILALNKPKGIVSTTDQREPKNMIDFINYSKRIFPIGRLDKDSEGLILLTNNGDIVNKILRAGNQHEKEYIVTVDKIISERFIKRMANGIPILGKRTKKCKVEKITEYQFRIILIEGMNRQIRRMCEYLGYKVKKLERIRIMNIQLKQLKRGSWRMLDHKEQKQLLDSIKDSSKTLK